MESVDRNMENPELFVEEVGKCGPSIMPKACSNQSRCSTPPLVERSQYSWGAVGAPMRVSFIAKPTFPLKNETLWQQRIQSLFNKLDTSFQQN